MTDNRPTVPPIENHYALLRNSMIARPQMSEWPEPFYYHDPFLEIKWEEDGRCNPETDEPKLRESFREYDVVATFTREQLGFALSLSQTQIDPAETSLKSKSTAKLFKVLQENERMRDNLKACLDWMEALRASGDAGFWEWEANSEYMKARALLEGKK